MQNLYFLMLNKHTYSLSNLLLTNEVLTAYINNFWNDIFKSLLESSNHDSIHLLVMCKVYFNDPNLGHRTIGQLRKVNFSDRDLYSEYLTQFLGLLTEAYTTHPISKITFTYISKKGEAPADRGLLQEASDKKVSHSFHNLNLPISMNPLDYGDVILSNDNRYVIENNKRTYIIDVSIDKNINNVKIQGINLQWTDTKISDDVFKREIGKSILYFMGGELVLRKKQLNAKPFAQIKKDKNLGPSFITMDIETINRNGKLTPYLICAYDGNNYITSYASEYIDTRELFSSFINQLLNKIERKVTHVYVHNLAGFDGNFLLKHLFNFGVVNPLLFNGRLISIKLKTRSGKTLIFKDSYLLLPLPLRKLCVAFDINMSKGFFPFSLSDHFYKGILPPIEYWNNISNYDFDLIAKKYAGITWSFRDEAIKYCKLDCKCLYDVLNKFNELIFKEFSVNIHKSLTLPALAMKIYKSQYMPKDTIYQLLGNVDKDIRECYTGGAVDSYIPHNKIDSYDIIDCLGIFLKKLFYYDVNSLYPFVMKSLRMPVGKPIEFEGDVRAIESPVHGFFYCKITSPDYLEHPILQRRIKTKDGIRTVAGLGSWTGWIYSEEMDNAKKFGYQFEILRGYQFKLEYIFSEYVDKMYNLRLEYDRSHPMNLIAKLLMNSLYGKFGMKPESTIVEVFNKNSASEVEQLKIILNSYPESLYDYYQIDDTMIVVRDNLSNYKYDESDDLYFGLDVNVAIASAITSYGRMWMSQFKNNPLYKLFYSDTDSIVIDTKLPSFLVGSMLGQLKLEYEISNAVFLAPKVYGFNTTDGKEIIKIKGLTQDAVANVSVSDLEKLLIKDSSMEFTQNKWYKNMFAGNISIKEVIYNLKTTSNKRSAIYVDNVLNNTRPYNYSELISDNNNNNNNNNK
jgi:hypothetical protein